MTGKTHEVGPGTIFDMSSIVKPIPCYGLRRFLTPAVRERAGRSPDRPVSGSSRVLLRARLPAPARVADRLRALLGAQGRALRVIAMVVALSGSIVGCSVDPESSPRPGPELRSVARAAK